MEDLREGLGRKSCMLDNAWLVGICYLIKDHVNTMVQGPLWILSANRCEFQVSASEESLKFDCNRYKYLLCSKNHVILLI